MSDPLLRALDAAARPVRLFIRDDDAGWDDAALLALLDLTARAGVPIDLAVIPDALGPDLAATLIERAAGQPLGLHQHGCSHLNHETTGRKCEFGAARTAQQRQADLLRGRDRLQSALGGRLDPIFTPPWNRCSDDTPELLAQLGYAALSRDAGAPRQQRLPELPVHVDWTRQVREAREAGEDPGERIAMGLARHVTSRPAVGLMLHHAAMDETERALLARQLALWRAHPHARWCPMRELLEQDRA